MLKFLRRHPAGRVLIEVFDWYPSRLPAAERKLLRKLDLSILIFASLSFFCKFLDQSNISNAYVSGLKEELGLYGNELNYLNVAYYSAYVVGQVPFMLLQSRPSIAPYLLPSLEIVWAILTFAQAKVSKTWHLYLLRALVGFFEAPSFAGTHFVLGSFYRKEELFKRAGCWFMGNSVGSMFSGYLQAAAYKNLSGVGGMAGWRWLFIIDGVITLPIAFVGFLLFPGLPTSRKPWYLSPEEHELSRTRMPKDHRQAGALNFAAIKRALNKPRIYIATFLYICLIQTSYWSGYMSLWLKAEKKYSVELINILPTFINLVSAASSWLGTTLAGAVSVPGLFSFAQASAVFSTIVLTVWNVPDGLKFLAFYVGGFMGMTSPIMYSFVNTWCRDDPEERALILGSMMTFGYTSYVVIPLFTYATVDAPRFKKGYPTSLAFALLMWITFVGVYYYYRRSITEYDNQVEGSETASSSGANTIVNDEEKSASIKVASPVLDLPTLPIQAHNYADVGVVAENKGERR